MQKTLPAVLLTGLLSGLLSLISAGASAQPINSAKLDSLCNTLERNDRAMCAVLIAKNGHTLYHREIGYSKITGAQKTHADLQTEYRIGSASKMFTAVMILQLIEEKKLELSTPLSKFFPQIPNASTITIEEMLDHHSGLYDFTRDSAFHQWMTTPKTEAEMVALIAKGEPMFAPGADAKYSNTNFVLLGYIIEKLTGEPYPKELETRITKRIGLSHTYYGGRIGSRTDEAASFTYEDTSWVAGVESDMSIPGGAGAIVSTSGDLALFLDALFKGKLCNQSSLDRMITMKNGYGLGMFKFPLEERFSYGHTGHIDNFVTAASYFPDDSSEVIILANGLRSGINSIAIGVLSCYYGLPYTIPTFHSFKLSPEKLAEYQGTYSAKGVPIKLTFRVEGEQLIGTPTGQQSLPFEATNADAFQFEEAGLTLTFHRSAENKVDGLTLSQEGHDTVFQRE